MPCSRELTGISGNLYNPGTIHCRGSFLRYRKAHLMKVGLSIFFSFIFYTDIWAQTGKLPDEILRFYDDKNFISTYSLKSERDLIIAKLYRDKEIPEIHDERLNRIKELLLDLSGNLLHRPVMPGADNIPYELIIPEICRIYRWEQNGDRITISVNTFIMGPEDNTKFVSAYSPEKSPAGIDLLDLSRLKFFSRQIHEWYNENNSWHKSTLFKVFVE